MKWNMILGALVVSVGLCSQSFGFELLNRMMAAHRHGGCCGCEASCCETSCCDPCEKPACEPACDSCGSCDSCDPCCKKKKGLFANLFKHHRCCKSDCCDACDACEPACDSCCEKPACDSCASDCCESACDSCNPCCKKKKGLLAHLFEKRRCCKSSCCDSCGGGCCGGESGSAPAATGGEAAPMPPAPMADPSASIYGKRRVSTVGRVARN